MRNVRFKANHFGDSSRTGRECDFDLTNVSYDESYALANPDVIYWATTNVWSPDGEGVLDPALAPSGDVPTGRPYVAGGAVDARNFFSGDAGIWNGTLVP